MGGSLVRQYDLNYGSGTAAVQLLQSITEKGSDGTALPAARYDYNSEIHSWSTSYQMWLNADIGATLDMSSVTLVDANSDGLPDIVKATRPGKDEWKVWLNKGNGWATSYQMWLNADVGASLNYSTLSDVILSDVNGDGLPDIVKTWRPGNDEWKVLMNNGYAPNLLANQYTPDGGKVSLVYKPSTRYDNTGPDDKPDLPFNLWLVEKKTANNGMTGAHQTNDVTTYTYKDGFYKWQEREFRGFGTIDESLPNASNKKYVFHQDDALKGQLLEAQTRDNQNNPFAETEYTYNSSLTSGIYTVKLTQEKNYSYDGTADNPKITQVDYQYDNFSNVTKKSELGDTGAVGDERFTYFEYVMNPTLWITNTLKHTYTHSANDSTKIGERWFYYDAHPGLDEAPTKGDVTKEVKWLEGSTNPVTLYEYNSFGIQTKVTNANNQVTTSIYDATGTFPATTTNAKNQTTITNYDLGTGNLLSTTDPNSFTTTYEYDVFGRIKKEIKPYDTTTQPTTAYQYFFDGTAPEGTLISKREVSAAAGTLDVYTWNDGLGRKLQSRAEAEDTTKQIVTNTFYHPNGEIVKETVPHLDTASTAYGTPLAGIKATEMTYDALERVTSIKNPNGDLKTTAYDHWKETETDEKGHTKREFINARGKISKVEEVNGSNTYATNYEYNVRDELTKITDALGNVNTLTYDTLGRRKSQTDPDMGAWLYEYDGVDNLTKKTDNRGIVTTFTYDALNRRTGINYPTKTDEAYVYDGNNKVGTLTSVTGETGSVLYAYDNRLRKTQEQRAIDGTTWTTQFAYDALDRMTTRTNPGGNVITYSHNTQGEINSLTEFINNIDYNALGKVTKKDFANTLSTNYTYNADDFRLNRIQTGSVFDSGYTYDKVGNILSITDNLLTKTQSFGYDDLDRLTTAQETGGYNHAYEYNAIGNLTKLTDAGNAINYTYGQNAGPHALTSSTETAPTPTPVSNGETELLGTTWTLTGNNGSDEKFKGIPADSLVGKQFVKVTFDLHGSSFGGGDDEASIVFVQNGDWRAANLIVSGAQNGLNGLQTITIPISSFHKVGNGSIVLDPNQAVSNLHARFWHSSTFSVDITSVKVH